MPAREGWSRLPTYRKRTGKGGRAGHRRHKTPFPLRPNDGAAIVGASRRTSFLDAFFLPSPLDLDHAFVNNPLRPICLFTEMRRKAPSFSRGE